jgi:hypothetical protein
VTGSSVERRPLTRSPLRSDGTRHVHLPERLLGTRAGPLGGASRGRVADRPDDSDALWQAICEHELESVVAKRRADVPGAVGLCSVIAAKRLGAELIILLGRHPDWTALGRDFGATDIISQRGDEARRARP